MPFLLTWDYTIQGLGVGNLSLSLPPFGAEMAQKKLRGSFSDFMQMAIVTGLFIASVCNVIIGYADHGGCITNGLAIIPHVIVTCGIFCVPESPRWVFQHEGRDAAKATLKTLRMMENVGVELQVIESQLGRGQVDWQEDMLKPSVLKRIAINISLQVLQ